MIGTKKLGVASQSAAYRFGCKALAVVLAAALTAPMTGGLQVDKAYAEGTATNTEQENTSIDSDAPFGVRGVDFMQPGAKGAWEVLRVDDAETQTLYLDIARDGQLIASRFPYVVVDESDVADGGDGSYAGDTNSKKLAQIVELNMTENDEPLKLATAFADANDFHVYTIKAYAAKKGSDPLYEAQIYPIYAKLTNPDDPDNDQFKFLGIRTAKASEATVKAVNAGRYYWMGDDTYDAHAENPAAVIDPDGNYNRLVIVYDKADEDAAVSGSVKFVDMDGNCIKQINEIDVAEGVKVPIKSFFYENGKYYRVIDRLVGNTVYLNKDMATKQVRVIEVTGAEAGSYFANIRYVAEDDEGNEILLWADENIFVKGQGYKYTLPEVFSLGSVVVDEDKNVSTDRESKSWGVEQYTLDPSYLTVDLESGEDFVEGVDENGNPTTQLPVISLDADSQGNRTITAHYTSSKNSMTINVYINRINGVTQEAIGEPIVLAVTPETPATFSYDNIETEKGETLVPWAGNAGTVDFSWEKLQNQEQDVNQYVYYVPEDYVPGDAYDVAVQYMNVANSRIIRTEYVNIDPEITNFVDITSPASFTEDGVEYVRLAGQEVAPRHAFLSPTRTYTIYYRDVNDVLNANIVVRRLQINETQREVLVPGTTVTAAPVAGADGTVDAGVGAGDGNVVINDDNNPLTNLNGQDTSTERAIADDENPLASGIEPGSELALDSGALLATFLGVGVLAALGIALLLIMRRRKKQEEQAQPAYVVATTNTDHTDEA